MEQYTDSKSAQIGITTMFGVLVTTDLVGNTLVCLVIILYQEMRTPVNFLLLSLAVADMLFALFIGQRFVLVHLFEHPVGMSGTLLCKSHNLTWVGGAASVFTLVAIAFERYYAVIYPYGNKGKLTYQKLKIFIPVSWICAVILNIPLFLTVYFDKAADFCLEYWPNKWLPKAYSLTWFFVAGIIPVTLMIVLYSRVVYSLWFKRENENLENARQGVLKVRKRVTKMVLTVSIIYGLCWLPNLTSYVLAYLSPSQEYGSVFYITSIVLVTCNSTVNPFIYVFVNKKFREKIKTLLCCGLKCTVSRVEPSVGSSHKATNHSKTHPTLVEDTGNDQSNREPNASLNIAVARPAAIERSQPTAYATNTRRTLPEDSGHEELQREPNN